MDRIRAAKHYVCEDTGRIDAQLAVSRALGDFQYKNTINTAWDKLAVTACPDVLTFNRTNDEQFFINACDGIWDCLSNQKACEMVKEMKKTLKIGEPESNIPAQILEDIIAPSIEKDCKGTDNMTCVVVFFK